MRGPGKETITNYCFDWPVGRPVRRKMGKNFDDFFSRMLFRRTLSRWRALSERAQGADAETLRSLRTQGRQLRRQIDRVLHIADGRLAMNAPAASAIRKPPLADWAWRPPLWCHPVSPPGLAAVQNCAAFGDEAKLFHDCTQSELTIRQIRNTRPEDLAPFALRMDVFRFDGSFLSLAIDLPDEAVRGLRLGHVISLDVAAEMERPIEIFARLNVRHGPNTEQVVRELPPGKPEAMAEFDLAYTRLNERRVERAWLDLILEGPQMNQIVIHDLTMSRRPRAAL